MGTRLLAVHVALELALLTPRIGRGDRIALPLCLQRGRLLRLNPRTLARRRLSRSHLGAPLDLVPHEIVNLELDNGVIGQ